MKDSYSAERVNEIENTAFEVGKSVGALEERERIIAIIKRLNDDGMTHSEHCVQWHLFAAELLSELGENE